MEIVLLAGVSSANHERARAIMGGVDPLQSLCHLVYADRKPTLGEVIGTVKSCDAVLTLDTFTGHLAGALNKPGVTIFYNAADSAWHVPDAPILSASIHETGEVIGRRLGMILRIPPSARLCASRIASIAARMSHRRTDVSAKHALLELRSARHAVEEFLNAESTAADLGVDLPVALVSSVEHALANYAKTSTPCQDFLERAFAVWEDSNLARYLRYVDRAK